MKGKYQERKIRGKNIRNKPPPIKSKREIINKFYNKKNVCNKKNK